MKLEMKLPCPKSEAVESYEILLAVCRAEDAYLSVGYKQMRDLLERICRTQMQNESLQMTDLSARISFVSAKVGLSVAEQNRLHTFRLTSNAILNRQQEPNREQLLRDAKTLAFFIRKLLDEDIPLELYRLLPRADATYLVAPPARERVQRMRVCFQYADEQYLYVTPLDEVSEQPYLVRYNIPQINEEFAETCKQLWRHAQVNLLDVAIDEAGILTPSFIVLEPDYLLDISSLAECFRDYGHHPANYFLSRLQPIENARPLLLGNIANLFLDEWIHAKSEEIDYRTCMQKAFRRYPIELAACSDLRDKEKERQFFEDCKLHFDHIRETVNDTFHAAGYELDKTDAVLEPSYICEALGLQGRLDYMQRDMSSFIEMKSGKADEYAIRGKVEPKENNKVQMLLYQAVLQYSMGMDHRKVKAYLLYTRYPLLYPSRPSWAMVRRVIDLRNRIVADEYGIQLRNSLEYTSQKLEEINASTLNERGLKGRFWETYLRPSIDNFQSKLKALSALEKNYFYAVYNFITKELYTSKSGDVDYEGRTGAASLWLSTLAEKCEAGEIIYDLKIKENHAADEHKAGLTFSYFQKEKVGDALENEITVDKTTRNNITENETSESKTISSEALETETFLPNFRQGDAIILYERNCDTDNVTNKMVFKGNIEYLTENEIGIRLRSTQQNPSVLPAESLYAIEHDTMDTTFRSMYQGLYTYLSATQERRDLLLSQRPPRFDESLDSLISCSKDDFTRVALKAKAAQDYFLLIGPPGTGKTSCALKKMVETFHADKDAQILLLSYTNRAVDEICKSLASIAPAVDFIRVGSELSCDEAYREHLIENELSSCNRRSEVYERIRNCRIIVGTVAAISGKPELFRLKHFDVAIIDEATQILEPQLLGILCVRGEDGKNAIDKFVLIGDHKQLPAVVQQNTEQSAIYDESLLSIGLSNLKDSLFERLYRNCTAACSSSAIHRSYDMLCRQGRMHPEVALFANRAFYGGRLIPVGLPHQIEDSDTIRRLAFYPSVPEKAGASAKINYSEARIVADLAVRIYERHQSDFDESRTLGIITPYRSQIALIKKEIESVGIPALNRILVDTVERFQGSERDVIIYSFCVNYPYQLKFLSNLTEEEGVLIDRKLNVALTRARKQMFITGVPELLERNPLYKSLLKLIEGF
ncbi:AAA domain-containing protein [Candidatus Bacteroides intestinigallinarum]|uniref:AAA domain-containing protein n=1 Tax=Candidatus Bacteroides intestinigallinarum TaxID=2838470 RepID=UPI002165E6DB|nr:AAA domain-containing protein [Candidatus Bacteroides intestinigallinarum]MCS3200913.1 AAA domain-containing protein [Candidatus Bacteroides intestinigallinarum]